MKRFQFRLDGVLRIRNFELEREQEKLRELEAERRHREARILEAVSRIERGQALLRRDMELGVDGRRLGLHSAGLANGRYERTRAEAELEEMMPALDRARLAVREARARVRSLEKLREKRALAHREWGEKLEQAALDELAIGRAARGVQREAEAGSNGGSMR
jgi:flagellar FliJ protein